MSKTTALSPEEWKQLCLLGTVQLNNFVQQIDVPTEAHFKLIDDHFARWRKFMGAWALSKPVGQEQEAPAEAVQANGAEPVKRKRGRPRKVQAEAVQ